jgi:epoxyqueuosine reductase
MPPEELTQRLKTEARRLGFDQVGIAPAVAAPGYAEYQRWLASGNAAGMHYLQRGAASRAHPSTLLEGVCSIIVVSTVYGRNEPERGIDPPDPARGKVARYALGGDYHGVLRDRLESLFAWLRRERPEVRGRAVVDTAPLLERDFARMAGLGWIGKNTMLIDRRLGSFTFLGALLVTEELAYDVPHHRDHCGSCTRCLDACPTGALPAPYELDARRCISYWTIEHRGMLADDAAPQLSGWVFGCDICQDVCPWNRKAPSGRLDELEPRSQWTAPDLIEWLGLEPSAFRAKLKGTALARAKRTGLLRNAALVLGSRRVPAAVGPLSARLADADEDPVVRGSAAWALGQIATNQAMEALGHHAADPDVLVSEAVRKAIAGGRASIGPGYEPLVPVDPGLEVEVDAVGELGL